MLRRVLTEVLGQRLPQTTARSVVRQRHVHLRAGPIRRRLETYLTRVGDVRALHGAPGQATPRELLGRLGVPLDLTIEGRADPPVTGPRPGHLDAVNVRHERGEPVEGRPELIHLLRRLGDGRGAPQFHVMSSSTTSAGAVSLPYARTRSACRPSAR